MTSATDAFDREVRRDAGRPMFTMYDDASGERVELSVATTANWVAKTANFLIDEIGLDPGDELSVLLPLHWQTAVVVLAAWSAGAEVRFTAGARIAVAMAEEPVAEETVVLTLAPMGTDLGRLVAAQPDQFAPVGPSGPAVDDAVAAPGSRILTTLGYDTSVGLRVGLLAALSGASVVMVRNVSEAGLAERCAVERVTHTAGVTVAGLPRLG
ncbi:MAG TPA: TIGR03089 family protein [Mycobacteriales bacterium]|nr:TIGR03089 family protein [Mycobacteriales bacterium]